MMRLPDFIVGVSRMVSVANDSSCDSGRQLVEKGTGGSPQRNKCG